MSEPNKPADTKPTIFILNLDEVHGGLFDSMYSELIELLTSKYNVQRARKLNAAKNYISDPKCRPVAILIADAGILEPKNASILDPLKKYVTNGGVAVFMALFSSFMGPKDMNKHCKNHWGLDWETGDYHRTDMHLNR
jgi:hypothetical protein